MATESPASLVAWWGATLSTFLASIRLWEIWRDRFQIDVSYNLTGDETIGNIVRIRNLSSRPCILEYWELLYGSGRWPRRTYEPLVLPDHDEGDTRIEPYGIHELHFTDEQHFDWGYKSLKGRKIYLRISIAGRKPILRLVYPTK
jgi:hypothetical protein